MADSYIVSKRVLSEILGISETSLTEWQKENPPMPVDVPGGRGVDGQYDTVAVIRWMIDRALRKAQIETPRDRLSRVQAERVELEIAEKRGELIPAEKIRPTWAAMTTAMRQAMRALPANVVPMLVQFADDQDAMRDLLGESIDDALTKLSVDGRDGSSGKTSARNDGAAGAAAEDPAVAVG